MHESMSKNWMDAYPAPSDRSDCPLNDISVDELEKELNKETTPGKNLLIVDVRRADCLSIIPGAVNFPAHSFHVALPTLLQLLAPIPLVVFHCSRSNGKGPRTAGWYADALQKHMNLSDEDISKRVRVLKGGIVAWEERFGQGSLQERGVNHGRVTIQL